MAVRRVAAAVLVGALAVLGSGACSSGSTPATSARSSSPSASSAPSTTTAAGLMVVVGDSIPFGGHFCPGCTAFPDRFATTIQQRTGRAVSVDNRSRDDSARLADIESQLSDDDSLRSELAEADVVVVSIGFNNTPPWPTGNPCGGRESDHADSQVATVLSYPSSCVAPAVRTYGAAYDRIYGAIAELAPRSATLIAVNVYNNWIGNPGIRSDTSAGTLRRLASTTKRIYDSWNAMLCASARQHGFTCVDIYHAFNGRSGLSAPDNKVQAQDYTHPSQAGNDVIAALLAKVPLKSS